MAGVLKAEYVDWKNSTITKNMFDSIREVVEEIGAEILTRRASEPQDDQYLKGFIRGVQATMEWEPEFIEDIE